MDSTLLNSPLPAGMHVLLVEDDPGMQEMISDYLGDNDIRVTTLASGRGINEVLATGCIDLIILDRKLPGEDGMQIARKLREDSSIPIVILTGLKEEADRVMGLELGADDYLTKPFSPRELLARIRALMRRTRTHESIVNELSRIHYYRFSGWEVSVRLRSATLPNGDRVDLTNAEFNLLAVFLASPERLLTRDQLLTRSRLRNDEVYDRSIDVQIARLRKKLAFDASVIRTERGTGYMFSVPVEVVC